MKIILRGPRGSGKTTLANEIIGYRECIRTTNPDDLISNLSSVGIVLMDNVSMTRELMNALLNSHCDVIVTTTDMCETLADVHVFNLKELPVMVRI